MSPRSDVRSLIRDPDIDAVEIKITVIADQEGLVRESVREDDLEPVRRRVNEKRAAEGEMLLPEKVTPHTLRRTFASLALAAGRDPRWVMAQLGHTDARFTLTVYAQVMQRQRIDKELIWRLMRFPDEPESESFGTRIGTTRAEIDAIDDHERRGRGPVTGADVSRRAENGG
jgi:hypothetical protein